MLSPNRKTEDGIVVGLNAVGLSLGTIARKMNVHPSTIAHRLKVLDVQPADTRRTFMEDVFNSLSPRQQTWLMNQVGPDYPIKDFVRTLIIKEFRAKK